MKSFLSVFLALVMLLSFVACSGGTGPAKDSNSKDTTVSGTTTDPIINYEEDDLPDDLNFEGQTVKILVTGSEPKEGDTSISLPEICADELTSDVVNDSIYNREMYVEDRLNVNIEQVKVDDKQYENTMDLQFGSDDDVYQAYAYVTFAFTRYVFADHLINLYDLDYIDLEKPWWSQTFNEEAEVLDGLYVTTGSLSLSLTRYMFTIFYNKNLAEDHSSSSPELLELYDIVESGDWTFDKFCELGSSIYVDNNGNDTADEEDTFGVGFQGNIGTDAMWSSFDISVLSHDDDGWFELNVPTEKLYSAMDMINDLLHESIGTYDPGHDDEHLDVLSDMFASDRLLFMNNKLLAIESKTLRNMQSDYGILPFPKYDSNQKEYYTYAHDSYTSFGIPKTNRNPDVTAAILEAMSSYAYRDTEPAYLNTALKGKYMSDPQSRKMLDLVVDGFKVDAAWIYLETLSDGYTTAFRRMLGSNQRNYASTHATMERKVKTALKMFKVTTKFS
ncbi:MAG: hypothetical protein IKT70_07050 [Clostridia bacterium]|nr:hypothetical protein [Clostridia bacterium]